MFEVVIDPFFFHQSCHKIKVGFPILNAIFTRYVGCLNIDIVVCKTILRLEDLLKDFDSGLVLINSRIERPRQEPKPGSKFDFIDLVVPSRSRIEKPSDDTMKVLLVGIEIFDGNATSRTDHGKGINVGLLAENLQPI